MNSFRKLIPVAAAALMLGLGTNAFSQPLFGDQVAKCYVSVYADGPVRDCSSARGNIPPNASMDVVLSPRIFYGTLTADFKVTGVINREVYWQKTFSADENTDIFSTPLPTRLFNRWVNVTGSNLRGNGVGHIYVILLK
jgi:hypothetical protein